MTRGAPIERGFELSSVVDLTQPLGPTRWYVGSPSATPAFPGIGPDAAELIVERGAAGIGIDSMGVDPGHATDFPAHHITLPAGLWHLEGLVNLGRVPPRGACLVAAIPPIVDGSGAPARAFAILP